MAEGQGCSLSSRTQIVACAPFSSRPPSPFESYHKKTSFQVLSYFAGGGTGIRTLEALAGLTVFKTAAIDRSAIPPRASRVKSLEKYLKNARPSIVTFLNHHRILFVDDERLVNRLYHFFIKNYG